VGTGKEVATDGLKELGAIQLIKASCGREKVVSLVGMENGRRRTGET